jgi:hypothetical protein
MLSTPGSVKILVSKDELRGHKGAYVERTVITAVECVSADGRYLYPMIIWPASTHRGNWTTFPTPGWHYAYSESGYTGSVINLEWLKRAFDPQPKARANHKPRVLICDGHLSHESLYMLGSFVLKTTSSCVAFPLIHPTSFNHATLQCFLH